MPRSSDDQIGAGRGRRPGHGGDIRARLDRQARAARGGERPQRLDAERGPRLEDDDDVAACAADRVADHGRGAARRVARFTRLDHLGAGTGVGDARGERVPDRRVRPVRAGEDEGDRHARPTRRRSPLRDAECGRALDLPQHAFEARRLGGHRVERGAHARTLRLDVGQLPVLPLRLEPRLDPLVGAVRLEQRERRRDRRRIERRPGAIGGTRHGAVRRLDERQHRIVRRPCRHHELAIARRLAIGVEPRLVEGAVEGDLGALAAGHRLQRVLVDHHQHPRPDAAVAEDADVPAGRLEGGGALVEIRPAVLAVLLQLALLVAADVADEVADERLGALDHRAAERRGDDGGAAADAHRPGRGPWRGPRAARARARRRCRPGRTARPGRAARRRGRRDTRAAGSGRGRR